MLRNQIIRGLMVVAMLGVSQVFAVTENSTIVSQWNKLALQTVRDTNPGPPIVARMLAVTHTCMYDAWAAYDSHAVGTRLGKKLRRPLNEHTLENKHEAVSYAAYYALTDLFPSHQSVFDDFMNGIGYDPKNRDDRNHTPAGIGNLACAAVLAFRHQDGSNQLGNQSPGAYSDYTGYEPVNSPDQVVDPNRWQPLRLTDGQGGTRVQQFMAPHWGEVTPFAIRNVRQFQLARPAQYGSVAYREQAREVISYSAMLTDQQKVVAEYWADGPHSETPPGHWNLFAHFVSERDNHGIDEDIKMYFLLTNALMDASIWAWWVKREYDYVRPITAIRHLFAGETIVAWAGRDQGTAPIQGEHWKPYQAETFLTPPFSEYVSGHSTFSAAAAEVLRRFTASDVFGYSQPIEPGTSFVEHGTVPVFPMTLSWATFSDAADEAGISRRYGGIHFKDGDLEGRRVGREIGEAAWKEGERLFRQRQ